MENLYNTVYFTINIIIFALIIYQLFAKNKVNAFISSNILLIICFAFIVLSKLLIINYNYDLSMDESYNFASYLAFQKTSDIYWRDIDCGTTGPLHILIPYFFVKLGLLPINWKAFHLFSTLIFSLTYIVFAKTILIVNASLENKYSIILIGLLPMCLSLSIAVPIFESELFPVFFFVLSIYFFSLKKTFATGLCLFLACISKLQIVPITAALYLIFILFTTKKEASKISISGIISLAVFMIIVIIYGVWDEMIYYFIERNFNYSNSKYWFENILSFLQTQHLLFSQTIYLQFIFLLLIASLFILKSKSNYRKTDSKYILSIALILLASYYAIFKSGRNYIHYFYLVQFPILYIFAYILIESNNLAIIKYKNIALSIGSISLIVVSLFTFNGHVFKQTTLESDKLYITDRKISDYILNDLKLVKQRDNLRLFVWGKGGAIHVMTGLPQATPNNAIDYLVVASAKSAEKYKKVVFDKLSKNRPLYFVIKLEKAFFDQNTCKISEIMPNLETDFLNKYYKILNSNADYEIYKRI